MWFRVHEKAAGKAAEWTVDWPRKNASFEALGLPERVREQLKYDQGESARWEQPDGSVWQVFYLRWVPARSLYDRVRVSMAKSHNPESCLQAAGMKMRLELEPVGMDTGCGFPLNFRRYVFVSEGTMLYVFFSVAENMQAGNSPGFLRMTHWDRVKAAVAGSRNYGQRSLEVAIAGVADQAAAEAALRRELPGWVKAR